MAARIRVWPSPACLYDDPVQVKIEGLSPLQEVTVAASLVDESGNRFQSSAYYRAEGNGELDLSRSPSLGGSYRGVEPMGLLWALASEAPYKRLSKRDVLTPFCVTYEVHDGRGVAGSPLCSCRSERRFMADGVKRVPVREERLRATLFCPPGPGPFPAVIDLYGSGGGLMEYRASLLASRGFVTLALAFLAFEDIPDFPEFIDLDYFGEAIKFLQKQEKSIEQMGKYRLDQNIPFPKVMLTEDDRQNPKECYVFEDKENANVQIALHFPLVNDSFRVYKNPGVKCTSAEVVEGMADFVSGTSPYRTIEFSYSKDEVSKLINLCGYNIQNSSNR